MAAWTAHSAGGYNRPTTFTDFVVIGLFQNFFSLLDALVVVVVFDAHGYFKYYWKCQR